MQMKTRVRPKKPELQEKYGMLADVTIDVLMDDGVIALTLDGILLSRSRNGNLYLSMPSRKYQANGETRFFNYVKLFPKDKEKLRKLTEVVVQKARAAGVPVGDGQVFTPPSNPAPAPQPKTPPAQPAPEQPKDDLDSFFE